MLLRLTIENWMSFRDSVTFSMIASRERQHGSRLAKLAKYQMRVLPVSALYGGNASGKTNWCKAITFAQSFVVGGTEPDDPIPVDPFRLGDGNLKPTRFAFEILVNEIIYEFSFSLTATKILSEQLTRITSSNERVLYKREHDQIDLDPQLKKDDFFHYIWRGTRENQLYLTNAVSQKADEFKPVYNWFRDQVIIITPDARFNRYDIFWDSKNEFSAEMNLFLSQLDTGIDHLAADDIPMEQLPPHVREFSEKFVREGKTVRLSINPTERFVVSRKDHKLSTKKLIAYHKSSKGKAIKFEMGQESDGTLRLIDLLPAFLQASSQSDSKVYIIDELDRSLHTLLSSQLLSYFLTSCSQETRSQILFTTHDMMLMDQDLFRRDEMWIAERSLDNHSTLISFSEYPNVRYDKDIRKSYLQGRLGGIPNLYICDSKS